MSVNKGRKQIISGVFLGALLVLLGTLSKANAAYSIDPLIIEVTVPESATVATTTVTVQNVGSEPIRLKAYLENWTLDESGGVQLLQAPGPQDIAEKVRFNPKEFEVPAKSSQAIRLAVSLPADSLASEFRGMLFFEDLQPQSQLLKSKNGTGAAIEIKQRFGVSMYILKGKASPDPQVVSFTCPIEDGKLKTTIALENHGSSHTRMNATIVMMQQNDKGDFVPFHEFPINGFRDIVILPQGKRKIEQVLGPDVDLPDLPKGNYRADLHITSKKSADLKPLETSVTIAWPNEKLPTAKSP